MMKLIKQTERMRPVKPLFYISVLFFFLGRFNLLGSPNLCQEAKSVTQQKINPTAVSFAASSFQGSDHKQVRKHIEQPCSGPDFQSNSEYFRASSSAQSKSANVARQKAMMIAQSKIGNSIAMEIKMVSDIYINQYMDDASEESKNRFTSITMQAMKMTLSNVVVVCETQNKIKHGVLIQYICLEVSTSALRSHISQAIHNNGSFDTTFFDDAFTKIFEEEIAKRH